MKSAFPFFFHPQDFLREIFVWFCALEKRSKSKIDFPKLGASARRTLRGMIESKTFPGKWSFTSRTTWYDKRFAPVETLSAPRPSPWDRAANYLLLSLSFRAIGSTLPGHNIRTGREWALRPTPRVRWLWADQGSADYRWWYNHSPCVSGAGRCRAGTPGFRDSPARSSHRRGPGLTAANCARNSEAWWYALRDVRPKTILW